jgi:hypothetical protein
MRSKALDARSHLQPSHIYDGRILLALIAGTAPRLTIMSDFHLFFSVFPIYAIAYDRF